MGNDYYEGPTKAAQPASAKHAARWSRARDALKQLHGWPHLDLRRLAHRRRRDTTFVTAAAALFAQAIPIPPTTHDALGQLHEPGPQLDEVLLRGGSLLGQEMQRSSAFDDNLVEARLAAGRAMLQELADATNTLRGLARDARPDVDCFVELALRLDAAKHRAVEFGDELRAVEFAIDVTIAHEIDGAIRVASDPQKRPDRPTDVPDGYERLIDLCAHHGVAGRSEVPRPTAQDWVDKDEVVIHRSGDSTSVWCDAASFRERVKKWRPRPRRR